jgi:hypothetical protein
MVYAPGSTTAAPNLRRNKLKKLYQSPLLLFSILLLAIILVTASGPAEKVLGANVRIVYLHGAWVWAALFGFAAAALVGSLGLILRRNNLQLWSRALGRTGLTFWITYLPLSMWAMQTNWNGLFLAEPRWRFAMIFAAGGLILQVGVSLIDNPAGASIANIAYFLALVFALANTENVMHPPSPILNSNAPRIQTFFVLLLILILLAGSQIARWWYKRDVDQAQA